jgi:hypothetical protein
MDDDNNIPRILILGIIIAFAILLIMSSNVFTNPANSTYAQNSSNNNNNSNNASNDNNTNNHGLDRLANVTINGKSYLIRYGITNGKVLSIVADKANSKISAAIQPYNKNGKFTIELPRNIIDSKGQGIFRNIIDSKYIVRINGNAFGITYNEILKNNVNARTLAINFGTGDRLIEIKGTQMGK